MSQNVGTLLGSAIRPADSLDEFPVFHANEGLGGFYSVANITERDAITSSRRVAGMRIRVIDVSKDYELVGGITNSDWVEVPYGVSNTTFLIREEFDFTNSQIITLNNDYSQVYAISVSNGGILKSNEYTLILPNQIDFGNSLQTADHIVVIYSNTEVGTQPYYTQAQVDALIANISNTGGTGGDKNFLYEQAIPSNTWTISHNLSKYPSVTVFDSSNKVVNGDIEYINLNVLTLTFNSPFSGKASLN